MQHFTSVCGILRTYSCRNPFLTLTAASPITLRARSAIVRLPRQQYSLAEACTRGNATGFSSTGFLITMCAWLLTAIDVVNSVSTLRDLALTS